jgi:hypothetical protein
MLNMSQIDAQAICVAEYFARSGGRTGIGPHALFLIFQALGAFAERFAELW